MCGDRGVSDYPCEGARSSREMNKFYNFNGVYTIYPVIYSVYSRVLGIYCIYSGIYRAYTRELYTEDIPGYILQYIPTIYPGIYSVYTEYFVYTRLYTEYIGGNILLY